jgi:hypothetical protein
MTWDQITFLRGERPATEKWRRLPQEKANSMYSTPNIMHVIKSRRIRWAGHVACMEDGKGANRILLERPDGRQPFGRPRNNIQIYFQAM